MPSSYRVLRYYPNVVNGERINVAVVAYDQDEAHARVLRDWSRVQAFAGTDDLSILERVASGLLDWSPDMARSYRGSEMSSVELTEPRASATTAAELIDRIAARMLVEPQR